MACQSIVSPLKLTLIRWSWGGMTPHGGGCRNVNCDSIQNDNCNHTTAVGALEDAASGQIAWERKNEWMNQRGPSKLMLPSPRNPTGRLIVYILLTCQWHASNIFTISLIMADSHYRSIINISCQEQSAITGNYLYKLVRKQASVYHTLAWCRFFTFRHSNLNLNLNCG